MTFQSDLNKLMISLEKEVTKHVRAVASNALNKIVTKTPVDTGCCRANWVVGIGSVDPTYDPNKKTNDAIQVGEARIKSLETGVSCHISNATPYTVFLEYGTSKQAASGMVSISIEEIKLEMGS